MRGYVLGIVLTVALASTAVFSGEQDEGAVPQGKGPGHKIWLRERHLELEKREAELDFQNEMWGLKLEKHRIELERARDNLKRSKRCGFHAPRRGVPLVAACLSSHPSGDMGLSGHT